MKVLDALTTTYKKLNTLKSVNLYVCGPTVYDYSHLGHGRSLITFDILYRLLQNNKCNVTYIQNITDIDDKIINKSLENNQDHLMLSKHYETHFHCHIRPLLNILDANKYPRVTDHVKEIIAYILKLIDKKYAYEIHGNVYFDSKYFNSNMDIDNFPLPDEKNFRVQNDTLKKSWRDFCLWKKTDHPGWPSPWSYGRPGWHVECSALSQLYIGDSIDIHGGGCDLKFPHHANEIFQSNAYLGFCPVNIWMHHGMVTVDNNKMSKSLHNFKYIHDQVKNKYDADVFRYIVTKNNYVHNLSITEDIWQQCAQTMNHIRKMYFKKNIASYKVTVINIDIFDLPILLSMLHDSINDNNYTQVNSLIHIIGFHMKPKYTLSSNYIAESMNKYKYYREMNQYNRSDSIREKLLKQGIQIYTDNNQYLWHYI